MATICTKIIRSAILILGLSLSISTFAQYNIDINAIILDKSNDQPIPFANILVQNSTVKAISDSDGKIHISYNLDALKEKDVVKIDAFGYKSEETTISSFFKLLKNSNKIYLVPKLLNEGIKNDDHHIINHGSESKTSAVSGRVTASNIPLQGVNISVENSLLGTTTNAEGHYQISARIGDRLSFEFIGMDPKEVTVDSNKIINVELTTKATVLGEVELFGEAKADEKNEIYLGLGGKKSFDAIGTSIDFISSKDIAPQYYELKEIIAGNFGTYNRNREITITNKQGLIYDVDGMIYIAGPNKPLPEILASNIESVTVLRSLAATNKYGSAGRGGVVIVKTKGMAEIVDDAKTSSALVSGNEYTEDLKELGYSDLKSGELKHLEKSQTFEEARSSFEEMMESSEGQDIGLSLEAAEYFLQWDRRYAQQILDTILFLAKDSPKALRSIAFQFEEAGRYQDAQAVYQRIAEIRPGHAQSYRDLAIIYETNGYYAEALAIYKDMLNNTREGVDFTGIRDAMVEELNHLVKKHWKQLDLAGISKEYIVTDFQQDVRVVFEWNDPSAEFELQFVNPKKKFYTWSHTEFKNPERIEKEIRSGFMMESNIIDDDEPGEWLINLEPINQKKSINPDYLKCTIYKDYASENEKKEVLVIPLSALNQKVNLKTLKYR